MNEELLLPIVFIVNPRDSFFDHQLPMRPSTTLLGISRLSPFSIEFMGYNRKLYNHPGLLRIAGRWTFVDLCFLGGPLQNVLQTCTSKTLCHSTVELRSVLPFCMAWQLDMAVVIIL